MKVYEEKKGSAGGKGYHDWLDAIPEWERIVITVTPLALASARSARDVSRLDQLNLKPAIGEGLSIWRSLPRSRRT